jgi:hypothetical protein
MSSWRCRFYRGLLVDYADYDLDRLRRQRVEKHLARCAECTADVAALQHIPALLQTSMVPDPGEEFWTRQQQGIRRAVRSLPSQPGERTLGWLHAALQLRRWRYAFALAVSIAVAWSVYRWAEDLSRTPPGRSEDEIAGLDAESAFAVNDVLQALVPADEYLPPVSADDERQLAALPLEDFVDLQDGSDMAQATDLDDADLDDLGDLVGDVSESEDRWYYG